MIWVRTRVASPSSRWNSVLRASTAVTRSAAPDCSRIVVIGEAHRSMASRPACMLPRTMTVAATRNLFERLPGRPPLDLDDLAGELREFRWHGKPTAISTTAVAGSAGAARVETFVNEFWTSRQRAAHSLHEISYRACFKPQLPRFFIERLTRPGDVVYDPFMGRGTTLVEAALVGRVPVGCDVNPLSAALAEPRLRPPTAAGVARALDRIDFGTRGDEPAELLTFYHP